jgi:hypothetical protein
MQTQDKLKEIVQILVTNEELLSELYSKYSSLFVEDKGFWNEISKDETVHASWLYELDEKVASGKVMFNEDRFSLQVVNTLVDYLKSQLIRADKEKLTPIQALSISMDIESSMLERKTFDVYESDNVELKQVLDKLRISTEIHFEEVKTRWDAERGTSQIAK